MHRPCLEFVRIESLILQQLDSPLGNLNLLQLLGWIISTEPRIWRDQRRGIKNVSKQNNFKLHKNLSRLSYLRSSLIPLKLSRMYFAEKKMFPRDPLILRLSFLDKLI